MATNFRANQYENAFKAFKLGNWQVPSNYRETPRTLEGHTKVIATDRGHLESGVPRSRENPWGNFVGTWDLPKEIPGNCTRVTTARTTYGQQQLEQATHHAQHTLSGKKKNDMRNSFKAMGNPKAMLQEAMTGHRSGAANPGSKMLAAESDPIVHQNPGPRTPIRSPLPQENLDPAPPVQTPQHAKYVEEETDGQ